MKKKSKKRQRKKEEKSEGAKTGFISFPKEAKKGVLGVLIFIIAAIVALSFFELAGPAGKALIYSLTFLIGKAAFVAPLMLVLAGLIFFRTTYEKYVGPALLAILIEILGIVGILETLTPGIKEGGWLGYLAAFPFLKLFGSLATKVIFGGVILVGVLIFWKLIERPKKKEPEKEVGEEKPSLIKQIFSPKFQVKEVEPKIKLPPDKKTAEPGFNFRTKKLQPVLSKSQYKTPPLDLLETDKGKSVAGDTVTNSAVIKKTFENFGLGVEMSEINIGPTVTQYTLKPADGIKLSKITGLNNNLSLALASHPIRIEAPIPGKSLVGIEVPNKERCQVRLRDLIANPSFSSPRSSLIFVLGKDVSGNAVYADLSRMPHLLVAGATGTGKTIFLNSLIMSLLYQNSPETMRLILIDPKRVEFSAYHDLPHLLCPVIFDATKTVLAFKWLISEMERRFEVLSSNGSRDISSYNEKAMVQGEEPLPYIVAIVDELADLMASKGREVEVSIVRLAQMARAVGIHLVLATQRPSVEVITGLIKANITSRVTFQVASQVDSRTVIDTSGAEKLLGAGDLLFISAEVVKPKRIQGAYVSEREVRKIVDWIKGQALPKDMALTFENHLAEELEKTLEAGVVTDTGESSSAEEDSLYGEAKKIVIEAKKASASLLQRRLRIGYARAARLLDILEERGVIGPGEGAKPREVYFGQPSTGLPGTESAEETEETEEAEEGENEGEDENWKKV